MLLALQAPVLRRTVAEVVLASLEPFRSLPPSSSSLYSPWQADREGKAVLKEVK